MNYDFAEKETSRQQRKEELLNSVRDRMGVRKQREEFKARIQERKNQKK